MTRMNSCPDSDETYVQVPLGSGMCVRIISKQLTLLFKVNVYIGSQLN